MNKLIKVILFLIVGMVQVFAWGGLRGDTLAKELDEAVLNRSFYLQQREQRITQLNGHVSLEQRYRCGRNMRSTTNYTRNSRKYNKTRPSIT